MLLAAGVDVSARVLHAVVLGSPSCEVAAVHEWSADDPSGLVDVLRAGGVTRAAIDAPAAVSAGAHADDEALGRKFRGARCGEVALGREHGVWVAWVPPPARPAVAWMEAGFDLFSACVAAGLDAVETFPYAVFRSLAGGARLPKKSSVTGREARVALLLAAGVDVAATGAPPTHDVVDAAACALVAADPDAVRVTCGHDDSAIWLPSSPI